MRSASCIFLLTLTIGTVWSQAAAPKAAPAKRVGYLTGPESLDVAAVVAPPPGESDPRTARDRAIYRQTRSYEGSPRWALALSDNEISVTGMLRGFSCSLGVTLTQANAPRLTAVLNKATVDWAAAFNKLKDLYKTKRPYEIEPAPICLPNAVPSPDYPSGHATYGWGMGLLLAELAPDAATRVLNRGKAYGESRVVCGVHTVTAVEGGVDTATAVVAAQHGSAAFRADMDAARAELATLRAAGGETPASCALENQALGTSPY